MSIDLERYQQLHAEPETPEPESFVGEWVLPVMGACACVLVAVALAYIFAAWWVA